MPARTPILVAVAALLMTACVSRSERRAASPHAEPRVDEPAPAASTSATASEATAAVSTAGVALSPPLSETEVADATGGKPESSEGTVKVTFPRTDVGVQVDGWKMPPFMGLTSWAAFSPGKVGKEAMVMGDLVLFEDEVNPVMSTLLDAGLEVTALHNHFFFDQPRVYFMHVGGEGTVATLGGGVKQALEKVKAIRQQAAKPAERSGSPIPTKSAIDAAKLETALGVKGTAKDGMFKAVMGREATAACGCKIGKALGVNTWAAFAGTDDNAVVDGDFAVTEAELQPVLKTLRGGGINIVALHHHMSGETPRILFLHYWGRGKGTELATTLRKALDQTAWEGKSDTPA